MRKLSDTQHFISARLVDGYYFRLVTRSHWERELCVIDIAVKLDIVFADVDIQSQRINGKYRTGSDTELNPGGNHRKSLGELKLGQPLTQRNIYLIGPV